VISQIVIEVLLLKR